MKEKNTLTVDVYAVLSDCVERGISTGYRRAFKHTGTPAEQAIKDYIETAVLEEVGVYFEFPEVAEC